MNYYIDTEFLEGKQRGWFGDTANTIDLISIAIVGEDGREYSALSKEFNLSEAWNRYDKHPNGGRKYWIRDNVLFPIYCSHISGDMRNHFDFSYRTMKMIVKSAGKTNRQIATEIVQFTEDPNNEFYNSWIAGLDDYYRVLTSGKSETKFYGYYCDYDWVAFCWLFGKMINLPECYPMYCRDLKQMWDELDVTIEKPTQENEHLALDDARWNKKLHEAIMAAKQN